MDFINLWSYGINELIFQHFTGLEILTATEVSQTWNDFIGRSSAFKKISLDFCEFDGYPSRYRNLEYLMTSGRKYRHLKAYQADEITKEIVEIICSPCNEFNSISLNFIKFNEEKNLEQIFLNTCKSLQRLKLVNVSCISYEFNPELPASYNFPKLKYLHLAYPPKVSPPPFINKYFETFDKLVSLKLINGCDETFKNLIQNSNLKRLEIAGLFYGVNFFKDLSTSMDSKLEEFIFNNILSSSKDDENLRYFNAFFWSQRNTLRSFQTDALIEPDELMNVFKMLKLTDLSVKGFHYNHELMRIQLENIKQNLPFKPAALTRFTVDYMDNVLFELLTICAPNLKELRIQRFDVDHNLVSNGSNFPILEVLKIDQSFNTKAFIISKPESARSRFENMVLSSGE